MNNDNPADSKHLHTLERWRSAQLETAQARHVKLEQVALEKQSVVAHVESDITATQSLVRDLLTREQPISPEALQRYSQFAALQAQELSTAQKALEASRDDADAAHVSVVRHFESLAVVERLRERREIEAAKDAVRLAQKRLDEHALSRMSGGADAVTNEE